MGGRLLAAGPGEKLHIFEDNEGQPSPVAERILDLVDGKRSIRDIAYALHLEFEVDLEVCARDTAEFIQKLVGQRLLVFVGAGGGGNR